nr:MAG TPA: hypothetical protein [Caudoviricetes sp.]
MLTATKSVKSNKIVLTKVLTRLIIVLTATKSCGKQWIL